MRILTLCLDITNLIKLAREPFFFHFFYVHEQIAATTLDDASLPLRVLVLANSSGQAFKVQTLSRQSLSKHWTQGPQCL